MAKRTPPFPPCPSWSTAKFWGFLRSGLRSKWLRWPPRTYALLAARTTVSGKRHRFEYTCSACNNKFKQKEVEVDHIQPVGSLKDYDQLPEFVARLFVNEAKLRIVCKPCHKTITSEERLRRKEQLDG